MNTVAYIRVSTIDQNPEMQRRELEQFALRQGLTITEFIADTMSGRDGPTGLAGRVS